MRLPRITVVSITGVDKEGHESAIRKTMELLPIPSMMQMIYIPGMTRDDYSNFMVRNLRDCIFTEFALIVQSDGYAINRENWCDSFLDYDYVGAVFPNGEVGNGGTSLRSQRFINLCSTLPDPDMPEDAFICQKNKEYMESFGVKFAPMEIASRFSFEHPCHLVENHCIENAFAFHGSWHLPYAKRLGY